ncbi:unnamed protein product [Closterium sp. Yama58-4]|nr:unnamed protein product [Closterium sp. Yama58-4]
MPVLADDLTTLRATACRTSCPMRFFYVPDANGQLVKAVPCYYAYPADFIEACRATATMQTGTKRPCTTCYVEEDDLANLKLKSTIRTPASQEHAVQQILACKTVKAAEKVQSEWSTHPIECVLSRWNFSDTEWGNPYGASVADTIHVLDSGVALHMIECHIDTLSKPERRTVEGRKKTTKTETPSTVLRLPGGSSYLASGANYAAFEHRAMMQVMPILVADKGALGKGPDAELRAMRVRAFRLYATFYKAFLGVDGHTRASLAHARELAYRLVDLLPRAYPDQKSGWRFPKVHMIKHLLENVILRGMPHHYNTELWEHTHKGTVKVPVRGGNWKDIPRRIVEEEVQREICREVAADAGGGWQYTTALREAVRTKKPVLTRKGRLMVPGAEDDAVLAMYHASHGDDMKDLVGCMRSAGVKAERVQAHTAVAIPRTRGGALVAKGTFVKASPGEKWFSDVALLAPKGGEWFAKVLCIFKAAGDEGEPKGYMYVRYYEQAGLCPLTTCIQLTPHRMETRFAVVEVATILRVVHICRSFSNPKTSYDSMAAIVTLLEALKAHPDDVYLFSEFPFIPTRLPVSAVMDAEFGIAREWHMMVGLLVNASGSKWRHPLVVLRRDDGRAVHNGRRREHNVVVRYAKHGRMSSELFTEHMVKFDGDLFAKNERAIVLVYDPKHELTGCVFESETVAGFAAQNLLSVKVVQLYGGPPRCSMPSTTGVVDTVKAIHRYWFMKDAMDSNEWKKKGEVPRPSLPDVLRRLELACKLTSETAIQRSWWRAGCVPTAWVSLMKRLDGAGAALMFEPIVSELTMLQMAIENFKRAPGMYMTSWDFVGCDKDLLIKWGVIKAEDEEDEEDDDEIPAYFCIPEGPLYRDVRSRRRVVRMVAGEYSQQAGNLGIPVSQVPEALGAHNEEVISRLRRTPTKRARNGPAVGGQPGGFSAGAGS